MGIRGIDKCLESNSMIKTINIKNEVIQWQRNNPNAKPTIVIDLFSLCSSISSEFEDDFVYGGRHLRVLDRFRWFLQELQNFGCILVFFADYNIQDTKKDEWLRRRNQECEKSLELYDWLYEGHTPEEVNNRDAFTMAVKSTCHPMELYAQMFGTVHYCTVNECDIEIARYAATTNILAIMSADTDFMIFDVDYRFWSSKVKFSNNGEIFTHEYDRNAFTHLYGLSRKQLPIFASLLGTDLTKKYLTQLYSFQNNLKIKGNRFEKIAQYVNNLSDNDLDRIASDIFGFDNDEFKQVLRQSLDSYNIDEACPITISDPIASQIVDTIHYPAYITVMSKIHGVNICYFDARGQTDINNLPMLFLEWTKKKVGVLRKHMNDSSYRLTVLARNGLEQQFMCREELPIYPEFLIPYLPDLYLGDADFDNTRYSILSWIMSIPDDIMCKIKTIAISMRIAAVSVYALVQKKIIEPFEADGILYTENSFLTYDMNYNVKYPEMLTPRHVRIAHLYNATFSQVRQNFEIAGFRPESRDENLQEKISRFDGVYFNELMERVQRMDFNARRDLFIGINEYRVYAN